MNGNRLVALLFGGDGCGRGEIEDLDLALIEDGCPIAGGREGEVAAAV